VPNCTEFYILGKILISIYKISC